MVSRSPAQPVFGNARKGFNFHICGNILKLQDYPQNKVTEKPKPKNKKQQELTLNESLEDFLKRHDITYTLSKDSNKYYVDCPYQNGHTGQKQGATDFIRLRRWHRMGILLLPCPLRKQPNMGCLQKRTWHQDPTSRSNATK